MGVHVVSCDQCEILCEGIPSVIRYFELLNSTVQHGYKVHVISCVGVHEAASCTANDETDRLIDRYSSI